MFATIRSKLQKKNLKHILQTLQSNKKLHF